MTLIEKDAEKCAFLRRVIDQLELPSTDVVEGIATSRTEGLGTRDLVTARKVGRIDKVLEWCGPLLAPGARSSACRAPGDRVGHRRGRFRVSTTTEPGAALSRGLSRSACSQAEEALREFGPLRGQQRVVVTAL